MSRLLFQEKKKKIKVKLLVKYILFITISLVNKIIYINLVDGASIIKNFNVLYSIKEGGFGNIMF